MPEPTDPLVPEPEHEAQPILKPPWKPTITDKPVKVERLIVHYSKWDYFCMGARRALKATLYSGGVAVVVSGVGIMCGVPFLLALKGSGLMVGGTALAMGSGKIIEEKAKAEGKTVLSEKIICAVITAIVTVIQTWLKNRSKGVK